VAIPAKLSRRLHETLGEEAASDMVHWMEQVESNRAELHDLGLAMVRMDAKLDAVSARLEAKVDQRVAELMKWSFVFWVGAVSAMAVLAGVVG